MVFFYKQVISLQCKNAVVRFTFGHKFHIDVEFGIVQKPSDF
ncbi:hypothetical protein Psch_02909 [Pelotomaculum schinkii]|uniref:Uncharacterized protein n=1 Tax=Pelotomaculum schinkii TaxID=78350 RepID=A0A4Y7RC13_9FIRM|nr:hypothetical protein Psch_02909 [Pelotomaculum schinkii]